nr:hypothetical protein [Cupriavidus taiwanensis]
MIINLDESRIRTLAQVRAVLDGTQVLDFTPATDAQARCDWMAAVLRRLYYRGSSARLIGDWFWPICATSVASAAPHADSINRQPTSQMARDNIL